MILGLCIGLSVGAFIGFIGCALLTKGGYDDRDSIIRRLMNGHKNER